MKNPNTLHIIYRGDPEPIDVEHDIYTTGDITAVLGDVMDIVMRGPPASTITKLTITIRQSDGQAIVSGMDLLAGKG